MAFTDKNILIVPNIGGGESSEPLITLTGSNSVTSATIYTRVLDAGALSFEAGSTGQVGYIGPGLSGDIYSVNDISGIPSIQVQDTGAVNIATYQGYVNIGSNQQSTTTGTGSLRVLGGVGISGNLNIGGSFNLTANLGVGGSSGNYGLTISTTTNVAELLYTPTNGTGLAFQVGASTYPLGIGFNSYNNVGTTYVLGNGYNAQLQLNGSSGLQFFVSSASQSAGAVATQINALTVTSGGVLVPSSTANGTASTGTGAIITYGGISAALGIITGQDAFHGANGPARFGTGPAGIANNTVAGYNAGNGITTGGTGNSLFGYNAGSGITSGGNNTILGYNAGPNIAAGASNTAIGQNAMNQAAGGSVTNNTAIGKSALGSGSLATGGNTAVGANALLLLASGQNNTAIGYGAGSTISSNNNNVLIGYNAGNALGYDNCVIIGNNSGGTVSAAGQIVIANGAGTQRIFIDANGNVTVSATTAASTTAGVGSLIVSGGASIASGLNLGGALYAGNSAGTNGYFLQTTGSGIQWAAAGVSVANITTSGSYYPTFTNAVSGQLSTLDVDSTHLIYNPSTGTLTTTGNTAGGTGVGYMYTAYLGVNVATTNAVNNGAVMQIGYKDGSTNLLRIGDGSSGQSGYRFRVDQTYNFIANNGSGDNWSLNSANGYTTTPGQSQFTGSGIVSLYVNNGTSTVGGDLTIKNTYPTICWQNTSYKTGYIHCNSNLFYILSAPNGSGPGSWAQVNGQWPAYWDLTSNTMYAGGTINVVGDINYGTSDERLKNIEGPITDAVAKVMQLEGFYYTDNEIATSLGVEGGRRKLGLSAQKLQTIIPEVVGPAPFDRDEITGESRTGQNYLTAQYDRVVPLLVNAIKEHENTIQAQQTQIDELKALVQQLLNK